MKTGNNKTLNIAVKDNPDSRLKRLAEIGSFKADQHSFIVFIWSRDTETTPHIHIGDAGTYPYCREFQACLKIKSPQYLEHGFRDKLTCEQLYQLVNFLKKEFTPGNTNWQYALLTRISKNTYNSLK